MVNAEKESTMGLVSSKWVSLDVKACAWSYCILLWHVLLLFLGVLLFCRERHGRVELGREEVRENWEEWREGKLQSGCIVSENK